jgi:hypothetical protein
LSLTEEPPVRLCCGQAHHGVVCPDGLVLCCICFGRFEQGELHTDTDGYRWNICADCGAAEEAQRGG